MVVKGKAGAGAKAPAVIDVNVEKLIEDLRKGVPLGVDRKDLRRSRIYAERP